MEDNFEVKVPASTANLGPGFDSYGIALPLYLTIRVKRAKEAKIKLLGNNLVGLSAGKDNLIYKSIEHLCKMQNETIPPIEIEVESEIPLGKGLGSSGAAIIGGLLVANHLLDNKVSLDQIFEIATGLEGHPDNIGASLFGGFIVAAAGKDSVIIEKVPLPAELRIILLIPKYAVATTEARSQIPSTIPIQNVAFNIGHSSLLLFYLLTNQLDKIPKAMKDMVHQPYRQKLVNGLERILDEAYKNELFAAALSGAGPTILILSTEAKLLETKKILNKIVNEENMDVEIKTLSISYEGAEILVKT